jgi:ferritin-like protein
MHGSKFICGIHKVVVNVIIATIVQNDVIVGRFIKSMNMEMDAQYDYVIMQLMVANVMTMYEEAIKVYHNKFSKEVHKLIYHGCHGNARCNKAITM